MIENKITDWQRLKLIIKYWPLFAIMAWILFIVILAMALSGQPIRKEKLCK